MDRSMTSLGVEALEILLLDSIPYYAYIRATANDRVQGKWY